MKKIFKILVLSALFTPVFALPTPLDFLTASDPQCQITDPDNVFCPCFLDASIHYCKLGGLGSVCNENNLVTMMGKINSLSDATAYCRKYDKIIPPWAKAECSKDLYWYRQHCY